MQKLLKVVNDTLNYLKDLSMSLLNVALPLCGGAVALEILAGIKLGVLDRIIGALTLLGVTGTTLTWVVVISFFVWLNDKVKLVKLG